jgi:hypothetical protein
MSPARKIIQGHAGLREKGIRYSRQRLGEKIRSGEFPPPDGRTTDSPQSIPWWWERTIDRHLQARARAEQVRRERAGREAARKRDQFA